MAYQGGIFCLIGIMGWLSSPVSAQQGQLTDVAIQGFIYEPQRLSPTDARIRSLTLPQGFSIQRFAEGLDNPRMMAVAEDGTVYVTQRTPGNLVMLRDTDGDGVADVQKIVVRQRHLHGIAIRGREISIAPLPFVHWTVIDLPPTLRGLPENVSKSFAPLKGQPARQGTNSKSERGYFGPRPPARDPPHRYHFQIFALDTKLDLPDGFNRHALLQAMRGHVLAAGELVGTFQAPE